MSQPSDIFEWHGWTLRYGAVAMRSPHGDLMLGPTDLLVAIDETGVENLSDPSYPIFGLGGCAILVGHYFDLMWRPWALLKKRHFGSAVTPLHAAGLRARPEQLEAIGGFFRSHPFFRLAAILTDRTVLPPGLDRYQVAALHLAVHIHNVVKIAPARRIALVFEASQRTDSLAARTFRTFEMSRTIEGKVENVEIEIVFGSKGLCEPALEVADFVMHAAGKGVQDSLRGKTMLGRKDFGAVFGSVSEHFVHFIRVDSLGPRPAA